MLDVTTINDLRSLVGTSAFLPAMLSYVRNASSGNLPLDPGIFQAILQCMVAGDKYLILYTPEEDVALVSNLVVWTLMSIFDLPTQKAKIRCRTAPTGRSKDFIHPRDPNLFLRSLFIQSDRNDSGDRPRSRPGKRRPSFMRPASAPIDPHHPANLSSGIGQSNSGSVDTAPGSATPLIIAAPQPRPFLHAQISNPLPIPRHDKERPDVPLALVLSGLEHSSRTEQLSLAQALSRRQVVLEPISVKHAPSPDSRQRGTSSAHYEEPQYHGTLNLPGGFILIYVCPWNSKDRPNIHRSLLDLFAMSTTIYIQKYIRDAFRALPFTSNGLTMHSRVHYSHSNPPTPSPLQSPHLQPLRTPPALSQALPNTLRQRSSRTGLSQPIPIVPKQLIPRDFIDFLQRAAQNAYVSSQLSLYLSDLFSAVRHHPRLDGTFLTARSLDDAKALARAGRVLGTDPTGGELLHDYTRADYVELGDDDGDDVFEGRNSSELHGLIAGGRESVTLDVPRDTGSSRSLRASASASSSVLQNPSETLFVSEAAIARVVPRAVTHRIRVRDGPSDEILAGAIFGATFEPKVDDSSSGYDWDTRSTIKDILVEILAEV